MDIQLGQNRHVWPNQLADCSQHMTLAIIDTVSRIQVAGRHGAVQIKQHTVNGASVCDTGQQLVQDVIEKSSRGWCARVRLSEQRRNQVETVQFRSVNESTDGRIGAPKRG